jgi:hypothetical protein
MSSSVDMFKQNYGDETIYITATGNYDYSEAGWYAGKKTILINVAMADTNYIRLPEATTDNTGLHVRVVIGIACLDTLNIGFVDTTIQGGAIAMGDTNEGAGGAADHASWIGDVGDGFNRIEFDLDAVAKAGGTGGTVLDFWYTGAADVVIYRGHIISEVDAPTLATHATTTAVNA